MKAIILSAGIGSRLGSKYPKCLKKLSYGETIIQRQVRILRECGFREITAVVGFKKELIMEHISDISYVYNPIYFRTNTAKSLQRGIEYLEDDVLWVNGDVVFDKSIIEEVLKCEKDNIVVVDNKSCKDEEVRYSLNKDNTVKEISKNISKAQGEALGINVMRKKYLNEFRNKLNLCADSDYFEKAIEYLIKEGVKIYPLNVEKFKCIEVDFEEDFKNACKAFNA